MSSSNASLVISLIFPANTDLAVARAETIPPRGAPNDMASVAWVRVECDPHPSAFLRAIAKQLL